MNEIEKINQFIKKYLNKKRYKHTINVLNYAHKLCNKKDKRKISLMVLLHDIGKDISYQAFHDFSRNNKFVDIKKNVLMLKKNNTNPIYHCKISRLIAEKIFKIKDKEILDGILHHSTGFAGISNLGKILIISDMCSKDRAYKGLDKLRKLSKISIEKAYLEALKKKIKFVLEENKTFYPETINAYNSWIKSEKVKLKKK